MTGTFLKSTTAIVLSLSLAVPHAALAQVTLDDVELEVNTEGMTEAEIEALKLKKLEEMQAAEAQSLPEQAEGEAKGLLGQAVDAVQDTVDQVTGNGDVNDNAGNAGGQGQANASAEGQANANAQAEAAAEPAETAETAAEETAEAVEQTADQAADTAQAATEQAAEAAEGATEEVDQTADALREDLEADQAAEAEAQANAEAPADANADATAEANADANAAPVTEEEPGALEQAVDNVRNALTGEDNAETASEAEAETAEAEAATEAETAADAEAATDAETAATQDAEATADAETTSDTGATANDGEATADAEVDQQAVAEQQAEAQAAEAEAQSGSMAATATDTEGAEVVEETVTEEDTRSSTEEFQTAADAQTNAQQTNQQAGNTRNDGVANQLDDNEGLNDLGKIALFGLGALAVGQILSNGNEVVSNSGDRVVVQQPDGSYRVYKNDDTLIRRPGTDVRTFAYDDGSTRTVATRDNGVQIETIRAADGTVLRRTRILPDGQQVVLFDDTRTVERVEVNQLPQVSEADRSINFQQAQEDELRAALQARMPADVNRTFSLSQVRNINAVRQLVPEIDVDNITFETGSSAIRPEEAEELAALGTAMRQRIEENPGEVFLIEGHTDAVGSASYNLALSDRRAESVALALTEYFDVPPENMVVQGYGEYDLKIRTLSAERENRRAAVRRITTLLTDS